MWDWLKKLIGRSLTETEPRADIHLKANTEAALSKALRKLSQGQEGWITFAEAGRLFSAEDDNPLSETDIEGKLALGRFAVDWRHRSALRRDSDKRRIYFTRSFA